MKLLLDQNLGFRLVASLDVTFPGTSHVRILGMESASDDEIWGYAAANGYAILTKDSDFHHKSLLLGAPPKVIHLRTGNCSTNTILGLFEQSGAIISAFLVDMEESLLLLS
ncbi:MAG: DUF5615 family PIN-like protein [Bacteroidetes bacterium]|nr:DUF5615 family PIN-like protein [Bacteroidota bacterium]